jgi:Outer membrane protein beta-barrel domain
MIDVRRATKVMALALTMAALRPAPAGAEWQFKPFVGFTFAGSTTLIDPQDAVGHRSAIFGGTVELLGEILGIEADFAHSPAFFENGDQEDWGALAVENSGVTTITGNVVAALPRHLTQYTLRPYVAAGFGVMRMHREDSLGVLSRSRPAFDIGFGATGFLSHRFGVNWEVRRFQTIGTGDVQGFSFEPEQLSFWRATIALAIRP